MSDIIGFKDYLTEVSLKAVRIVRDGKMMVVKRCLNNDGSYPDNYKKVGKECVRMSQHEQREREIGAKIAARKRHNKEGSIERKREKSMNKRTWDE